MNLRLNRERLLLIIAGGSLLVLALDHFVFGPLVASWRERSEAIRQLRTRMAQSTVLLDQEARWLRWQTDYRARLLPGATAEAESQLLTRLDSWARQAGLRLNSLRPRWRDQDNTPVALELQLSGNGSLAAVINFIHSLETAPLALAVEQLELVQSQQGGSELSLNLRLSGLCRSSTTRSATP